MSRLRRLTAAARKNDAGNRGRRAAEYIQKAEKLCATSDVQKGNMM
jgi:hypothetical protein